MYSNRIKGLTNALVITFAVLLLALQISIFVSNSQLKKSFRYSWILGMIHRFLENICRMM